MSFTTLRPLILTKLSSVSALVAAYDSYTENTAGYPYASFEPSNLKSSMYTSSDNLREYTFDIVVFSEMTKGGRDVAIENLCVAVDAIVTAFDTDTTLRTSGGVHYVNAMPAEWGEFVQKAGPVKYAKLTLVCGVEISVV